MRFVLTTVGSAGDVFPMLGLALTLKQRGHDVLLATNGYFAPLAEKYGIPFEPLGTAEEFLKCTRHPDVWHPRKSFALIYSFFQPILKRQHEIFVEQASKGPIVGIASCLSFGARVAQESHGIPVLTAHLQPAVMWSDINPPQIASMSGPLWLKRILFRLGEKFAVDRVVCPFLNSWRKEFGLPPARQITRWWNSPTGVLCLFPDWFGPPQPDWPKPLIQTDFPLWNESSEFKLASDVEDFLGAGDPPLVFTPGSANVHGAEFFKVAVQACQNLKRRGILLTKFPEQIPTNLPESIRHFSYVPLDLLLHRSAAFIHHGGVGSTSQAFLAGIPQVLMPLAHDQFDNASRVERLNAGASLPLAKFTALRLTASLEQILNFSIVAESCREISGRLSARDGLSRTATEIEKRFA